MCNINFCWFSKFLRKRVLKFQWFYQYLEIQRWTIIFSECFSRCNCLLEIGTLLEAIRIVRRTNALYIPWFYCENRKRWIHLNHIRNILYLWYNNSTFPLSHKDFSKKNHVFILWIKQIRGIKNMLFVPIKYFIYITLCNSCYYLNTSKILITEKEKFT